MRRFVVLIMLWSATAFANSPQFINLKPGFQSFVHKAQNVDFETQLKLWKSEVENQVPDVYKALFGNSNGQTDEIIRKRAVKWFPFLIENSEKIITQFENFEEKSWPVARQLAQKYPHVDFSDVRVIALPSLMMFDGMITKVDGHLTALFGMDFFEMVTQNPKVIEGAELINNPQVIVAHEFTHVLHAKVSNLTDSDTLSTLYDPLWREGIALVNSQMLIPGTDLTNLLMEQNIAKKCDFSNVKLWAEYFIEDSHVSEESELWEMYGKWFFINRWQTLGVPKAGYCLGYNLVIRALRDHSLDELIKMDKIEAYSLIKNELVQISQ